MLVSVTPGGFEQFFCDPMDLADANPAAEAELAGHDGLELCPPPASQKGVA